jgi:coenzyme F420-0:L-glutamate ligase/coenzyme F420-1:gamma-L-glutamate ligase
MTATGVEMIALPGMPLVRPGDDLFGLIADGLARAGTVLQDGDILVLAQKIVSKANGRLVDLRTVTPSARAVELAALVGKDPRQVEVVLSESVEVVAHRPGVLVVEHKLGLVMANAGIDASNVEQDGGSELVLLLPENPDEDCRRLRAACRQRYDADVAVIVNDSVGRAWRNGTVGLAIGSAGLPALWDLRGNRDLFGRELLVSQQAIADELASAASLIQGQGAEGQPVVLIRGFRFPLDEASGADALVRPRDEDMFR